MQHSENNNDDHVPNFSFDLASRVTTTEELIRELALQQQQMALQQKQLTEDTRELISAFKAVSGAFTVLEWIAKVTKPVITVVLAIGAFTLWLKGVNIK